jgi:ferredoxin
MNGQELKRYKVNSECIGCRACAELSIKNFRMNDDGKAEVLKQPETLEEQALCDDAAMLCPTSAIEEITFVTEEVAETVEMQEDIKASVKVTENDNMKKVIDMFPELKEYLLNISPKFKRLQNPFLYNFICRFMSFERAARTIKVPVDNLIDSVNSYLSERR